MSDPTKAKLRMLEMGRGSLGKSLRGLNNYQYYVGGVPYYDYSIVGSKNRILIIKAPITFD